jgi:hypothetical protein
MAHLSLWFYGARRLFLHSVLDPYGNYSFIRLNVVSLMKIFYHRLLSGLS